MSGYIAAGNRTGLMAGSPPGLAPAIDTDAVLPVYDRGYKSDNSLFPDLEICHDRPPGSARGANYDPTRGEIQFVVDVGPKGARDLKLLLFSRADDHQCDDVRAQEIPMKRSPEGAFFVTIKGAPAGGIGPELRYGFRPEGPGCDPALIRWVVDPYVKAMVAPRWLRPQAHYGQVPTIEDFIPPKGIVVAPHVSPEPRLQPALDAARRIIYEMHVEDTCTLEGTNRKFADLLRPEVIGRLKSLGVTTIELLPLQMSFDSWSLYTAGFRNVWGYNPVGLFAVTPKFLESEDASAGILELQDCVRRLHSHGFEVIVDFVSGHTAEEGRAMPSGSHLKPGYQCGPVMGMRGLDPEEYYFTSPTPSVHDPDASGCHQTIRFDSERVRDLMCAARDWWFDRGFDGMRVDQARILGCDQSLNFHLNGMPQLFAETDRFMVAEPNDAKGFVCGEFNHNWSEWNYDFRDVPRWFFSASPRIDRGLDSDRWSQPILPLMAEMLSGNTHIYRELNRGINFAACHDNVPTWDATSEMAYYLTNGNGPLRCHTPQQAVELRICLSRAIQSFVIFAPGPFMISRGDEVLRTQNNEYNAYDKPECLGVEFSIGKQSAPRDRDLPSARQKRRFLEFMQKSIALRGDLKVFDTRDQLRPGLVRWYGSRGENLGCKPGLNGRREESWGADPHFLGALYSGERFAEQTTVPPVYVARWGAGKNQIRLPGLKPQWCWRLVMNSESGFIAEGQIATAPGFRLITKPGVEEHLFSGGACFDFGVPAVAVFQLVKKDSDKS